MGEVGVGGGRGGGGRGACLKSVLFGGAKPHSQFWCSSKLQKIRVLTSFKA